MCGSKGESADVISINQRYFLVPGSGFEGDKYNLQSSLQAVNLTVALCVDMTPFAVVHNALSESMS